MLISLAKCGLCRMWVRFRLDFLEGEELFLFLCEGENDGCGARTVNPRVCSCECIMRAGCWRARVCRQLHFSHSTRVCSTSTSSTPTPTAQPHPRIHNNDAAGHLLRYLSQESLHLCIRRLAHLQSHHSAMGCSWRRRALPVANTHLHPLPPTFPQCTLPSYWTKIVY